MKGFSIIYDGIFFLGMELAKSYNTKLLSVLYLFVLEEYEVSIFPGVRFLNLDVVGILEIS